MKTDMIDSFFGSAIFRFFEWLMTNHKKLSLRFKTQMLHRNSTARISFHAILKVKIDNKYLLIKNVNRPSTFAPIGGAYRYYSTAKSFFDDINFDPQGGKNKFKDLNTDIRGFLPCKNLFKIIKWFESEKDRELSNCVRRELIEELEEIKLFDLSKVLKDAGFRLVRKVEDGPHEMVGYNYYQYSIFHVFEFSPDFLNELNAVQLLNDASVNNKNLKKVTRDEILKRRTSDGFIIGSHSGFLFGNKRTGPYDTPFELKASS